MSCDGPVCFIVLVHLFEVDFVVFGLVLLFWFGLFGLCLVCSLIKPNLCDFFSQWLSSFLFFSLSSSSSSSSSCRYCCSG